MKKKTCTYYSAQVNNKSPQNIEKLRFIVKMYHEKPKESLERQIAIDSLMYHFRDFYGNFSDVDDKHGSVVAFDHMMDVVSHDAAPLNEYVIEKMSKFFYLELTPEEKLTLSDIGKATLEIWVNETVEVEV